MKQRCPWCGEVLKSNLSYNGKVMDVQCSTCGHWSHPYRMVPYIITYIIVILATFYLFCSTDMLLLRFISFILVVFVCFYLLESIPMRRMLNTESSVKETELEEIEIGVYSLKWNMNPKKIFHIWNNAVLFFCVANENDEEISQMICVRVERLERQYRIRKIDDRVQMDYIQLMYARSDAKKIHIYNDKKKIGEGYLPIIPAE